MHDRNRTFESHNERNLQLHSLERSNQTVSDCRTIDNAAENIDQQRFHLNAFDNYDHSELQIFFTLGSVHKTVELLIIDN